MDSSAKWLKKLRELCQEKTGHVLTRLIRRLNVNLNGVALNADRIALNGDYRRKGRFARLKFKGRAVPITLDFRVIGILDQHSFCQWAVVMGTRIFNGVDRTPHIKYRDIVFIYCDHDAFTGGKLLGGGNCSEVGQVNQSSLICTPKNGIKLIETFAHLVAFNVKIFGQGGGLISKFTSQSGACAIGGHTKHKNDQ